MSDKAQTYHNECATCHKLFWTWDGMCNICPSCEIDALGLSPDGSTGYCASCEEKAKRIEELEAAMKEIGKKTRYNTTDCLDSAVAAIANGALKKDGGAA